MSLRSNAADGARSARIQVLVGATIIGFSSVFVKLAHVGPTTTSIFSTIFLALEVLRRNEGFVIPDGSTWGALLVLGVGCQAVGWRLIIHGMPEIPLSAVGLSILLQASG
ncbi:MAG: hypothetical protein GY845_12565 [Planctomycetes bacterium]|nr:hypothetical protein [Planctomycetota bacterium]